MTFSVHCESCEQFGECVIHLHGGQVETIILPRGWRPILREPGGMHTHDAVTFQCPRCGPPAHDEPPAKW